MTGVWDDERREAAQQALRALERPYVDAVWTRTEQELDAYAKRWEDMFVEACEATSVRGEQSAEVMDLRWLAPLPTEVVAERARAIGRVLIVDEGRRTGSLSEGLICGLVEAGLGHLPIARVVGDDCLIPLGDAWEHVLPSESSIVDAVEQLIGTRTSP